MIVAAALVDSLSSPTRFLAAQRSYPPELAGMWELPGGKVEPGESPEDACRREILEELGVSITLGARVVNPVGDGDWPIPPGPMRVWLAVTEQSPRAEDHMALRWCTADDLDLPWLSGDIPLVAHLKERVLVGS